MRRISRWAVMAAVVAGVAVATPSHASDPPSHTVTAPPPPGTVTVTWTGTILPGAGPTSSCSDSVLTDDHAIDLQVPPDFYDAATSEATFSIEWDNADNDEILTVTGPDGEVGSSDGGEPSEVVIANDLEAGDYTVSACPFLAATPQEYTGRLTFETSTPAVAPPTADAQGLAFSASVPADPQRDESEPDIRIDGDGNIITCGPTGFSNASDYAQVSIDGGDQFHLMGAEPRGQQSGGGGGDCGLAFGVKRNEQGNFQYAYTGLGPLTGFATSTSPDNGRTLTSPGPQGNLNSTQGAGVDRQWMAFLDDQTVLLSYNQQASRNIVVQKSTNGGLSYDLTEDVVASESPLFPGPMRSMPADLVGLGDEGEFIAYYGWNDEDSDFSYVNLAVSDPSGLEWKNCVVQKIPREDTGDGLGAFTVADNDQEGNLYLTYADGKGFNSFLTTLKKEDVAGCDGEGTAQELGEGLPAGPANGWSEPLLVNRGNVRTTVFPWLAAKGEPGRVAIAFYGTESEGNPNTGAFKASWDVYVNQSLNALDADPTVSQVKATTHPFHYDSICLNGLGCDLSAPPGDRSLADFFAIDYDPKTKKLMVVYDQSAKQPDEAAGRIATPAVVTQTAGPSNGGGTISTTRPVVRPESQDPAEDALADFSNLNSGPPSPVNVPAMDFRSQRVGAEVDPESGRAVADGGFTARLRLGDLSDAALTDALEKTKSGSLLWIFRFVNGYTASAAVARWSPAEGFTFGYNDYTTGSVECGSSGDKCQLFPGDKPLKGKADQNTGLITLSVPRGYLKGLNGPTGDGQRPQLVRAQPGTRFYDATAFSLGNTSPDPRTQSFLYPIDNPPAMDFLLPASGSNAGGGTGSGTESGGSGSGGSGSGSGSSGSGSGSDGPSLTACQAGRALTSATARGVGRRRLRIGFDKSVRQPVRVDVFQQSRGRRVIGERLVARFEDAGEAFTWDGRANRPGRRVRNGIYMVRFRARAPNGVLDTRRIVLRRTNGRFRPRPGHFGRDSCRILRKFKLERPVFGGTTLRSLGIAYRLARRARVRVTIRHRSRVVKRFETRPRVADRTYRLRLSQLGLRRGDYFVSVRAFRGDRRQTRTLVSRKL